MENVSSFSELFRSSSLDRIGERLAEIALKFDSFEESQEARFDRLREQLVESVTEVVRAHFEAQPTRTVTSVDRKDPNKGYTKENTVPIKAVKSYPKMQPSYISPLGTLRTRNEVRQKIYAVIKDYFFARRFGDQHSQYSVFITKSNLRSHVHSSLGNAFLKFFDNKDFYKGVRKLIISTGLGEPLTQPGAWTYGWAFQKTLSGRRSA